MIGKALELSRLRKNNHRFQALLSEKTHMLAFDPSNHQGAGPLSAYDA